MRSRFLYSAEDCPRCRIFKGAAPGVNSLYDMRGLINRNLYPIQANEPFLPGHEISARFDLDPNEPIPDTVCLTKVNSNDKSIATAIKSNRSSDQIIEGDDEIAKKSQSVSSRAGVQSLMI